MRPPCHKCGQGGQNVRLRRVVSSNGRNSVCWYCIDCQRYAEKQPQWLPHPAVREILRPFGKDIADLECLCDYSRERELCAICGARGTEYNHWMPQCLRERPDVRDEWMKWEAQGAFLCQRHHDIWHEAVTPWMPGRGKK